MKKILLALALTLGFAGAAAAADLSSVGSKGVEATVDYSYLRRADSSTPWVSSHVGLAGLQLNAGVLGSAFGSVGNVSTYAGGARADQLTYSVGYANGLKLGSIALVGGVNWTGVDRGANHTDDTVAFGEISVPTFIKNVTLFGGYSASLEKEGDKYASLGAYININEKLVGKVGGQKAWTNTTYNGVVASLAYKF